MPIEWWDACGDQRGSVIEFTLKEPLVLAVDASVSRDTTALIGVTRHPDRENHPDELIVRITRAWTPSREHPMDYDQTLLPAIHEALDNWNVVVVLYDAYQLHQPMTRLRHENVVWVKDFSQMQLREKADKQLYDLIRERRIHHFGKAQPGLRQHILNANVKLTGPDGERMRLQKRRADAPIDLAVALSMAAHEALRLNLGGATSYIILRRDPRTW